MIHSKKPISLLILAGGLGRRYAGSKQIDGLGPNGEFLLEYALFDALQAGFNKVVVVVNPDVKETLSIRLNKQLDSGQFVLVEQKMNEEKYPTARSKPWGTGHAVLSAKESISEPFMIINADDYYGRNTYRLGAKYLSEGDISQDTMGMITFQLSKTLSDFGGVSRGICLVNDDVKLQSVIEHDGIQRRNGGIYSNQQDTIPLSNKALVSMNCWLLDARIFNHLEKGFDTFYSSNSESLSSEYFLPDAIQGLIDVHNVKIQVIESDEQWFGLTYAEDKRMAKQKIQLLIDADIYPKKIWNDEQ